MSMETNKIFAALLVAGIIAMLSGIISESLVDSDELEKNVYHVDVAEASPMTEAVVEPTGPEPIHDLLATADLVRGKKLSKACASCHTFNKGGANGMGPNLFDIVGSNKATVVGYSYSSALKELDGHWNYHELNNFLAKPKKYVPGTKMGYSGLKKTKDRAALIAWLRTLSDNPKPLP